jgi:hypothetical protein
MFEKVTKLPNGMVIRTDHVEFGYLSAFVEKPAVFELLVFDPTGSVVESHRYSTEEQAQRGHEQAVGAWKILLE